MILFRKNFYSDDFNVSLNFYAGGGLTGKIMSTDQPAIFSNDIKGIYTIEESKIRFSFLSQLGDLIKCFAGDNFFYSEHSECLILKYWSFRENDLNLNVVEVTLFDCPNKDFVEEKEKMSLVVL